MPLWSKYEAIGAFYYRLYNNITYRNQRDLKSIINYWTTRTASGNNFSLKNSSDIDFTNISVIIFKYSYTGSNRPEANCSIGAKKVIMATRYGTHSFECGIDVRDITGVQLVNIYNVCQENDSITLTDVLIM